MGNFVEIFHYKKNYRAGSHCGEMKDVVRSDPPQAENPAGRILVYFVLFVIFVFLKEILCFPYNYTT